MHQGAFMGDLQLSALRVLPLKRPRPSFPSSLACSAHGQEGSAAHLLQSVNKDFLGIGNYDKNTLLASEETPAYSRLLRGRERLSVGK